MKIEKQTQMMAVYFSAEYGWQSVLPYTEGESDAGSYVRISEPVTITFESRKDAMPMDAIVAAFDAKIAEAQQVVRNLEQKKAELLALPAPESA